MWIDVQIPYEPNRKIAHAYNRALMNGISDWVLFLDHDVFLCNPYWYEMCLRAVRYLRKDPQAAMVTCYAGGERVRADIKNEIVIPDSITEHIEEARKLFNEHGQTLIQITNTEAGYFMLLNRKIAKEIGFEQPGPTINNVDKIFCQKLMDAGYHIYKLAGLYVYHRRGMKHLKWK